MPTRKDLDPILDFDPVIEPMRSARRPRIEPEASEPESPCEDELIEEDPSPLPSDTRPALKPVSTPRRIYWKASAAIKGAAGAVAGMIAVWIISTLVLNPEMSFIELVNTTIHALQSFIGQIEI